MEIQEYFNINIISKLLELSCKRHSDNLELGDLILNNDKDVFISKSNKLIKNCVFINQIIKYFKCLYLNNKNVRIDFYLKNIENSNHRCLICNEISKSSDNVNEIYDIIRDYVKRLIKYNKNIKSNLLKPKISNKGKIIKRFIDPSLFENIFIKNIIGFLFLNLNEKNVEKLVNILTFTKKTVSNEIIEDITLIFENCKFINKIQELMPFHNYDIIINKMKNFKHNNCDLCLLLSELFKTSSNINEFLDIFKNEFKEDINTNYLLKGDYSNRKFTIFRWHVNDKYNQWDYLFKNIEIFRKLKEKKFFIKLIGIVRYFMLPIVFYKNNPNNYSISNYEKLSEMSIKEWNKYYKKHVEKFLMSKNLKEKLIDLSEYHNVHIQALKYYKKVIEKTSIEIQLSYDYIMNVDYNNQVQCFLAFYLKMNEDCKELLQIFYNLNSINKTSSLKKHITEDKLLFLNDMLAKIIQRWINIDKDRTKIFSQLNSKFIDIDNEYHLSYLYKIDNIVIEVFNDDLNIKIEDDYRYKDIDDEDYSPERVQRMINELKD